METIRRSYRGFCRAEELVVGAMIVALMVLIFAAAVGRFTGSPLNWANDIAMLLFAWLTFLGADVALKRSDFMRVEIIVKRFPDVARRSLETLFSLLSIGFLIIIVTEGIPLALSNSERLFQTLGISYLWATLSAPVGAILISLTIALRTVQTWRRQDPGSTTNEAAF